MAVLGKRKASESTISEEAANEIFRRHFESQFAPIDDGPVKKIGRVQAGSDDGDDGEDVEDNEWSGVSEDDDERQENEVDENCDESAEDEDEDEEEDDYDGIVEVVDHSKKAESKPVTMSKAELKRFMSSRISDQTTTIPKETPQTSSKSTSGNTLPEDAPSLLAQDLELRRLLAESHLLSSPSLTGHNNSNSNTSNEPKTFAAGRIRQKATDMRVQALGSKESIMKQQKMPMAMRKGIVAASENRERKRRREAKENGVILEREVGNRGKKGGAAGGRRKGGGGDGVDRPGVGRLRGAELRISDRDVRSIEGVRDVFGRRSGGGKGRRR